MPVRTSSVCGESRVHSAGLELGCASRAAVPGAVRAAACHPLLPATCCCLAPAAVQYLHALALALAPYGPSVLFYLAAAVSDFFMPWADMVRQRGSRMPEAGSTPPPPCCW